MAILPISLLNTFLKFFLCVFSKLAILHYFCYISFFFFFFELMRGSEKKSVSSRILDTSISYEHIEQQQ